MKVPKRNSKSGKTPKQMKLEKHLQMAQSVYQERRKEKEEEDTARMKALGLDRDNAGLCWDSPESK